MATVRHELTTHPVRSTHSPFTSASAVGTPRYITTCSCGEFTGRPFNQLDDSWNTAIREHIHERKTTE